MGTVHAKVNTFNGIREIIFGGCLLCAISKNSLQCCKCYSTFSDFMSHLSFMRMRLVNKQIAMSKHQEEIDEKRYVSNNLW